MFLNVLVRRTLGLDWGGLIFLTQYTIAWSLKMSGRMPEDWILLEFEKRIQSSKEWLCDFRFVRVGWEMRCDRLSDLICVWILWFLGSSQLKLKSPRTSSSLFSF
ncbi:hypothetical protein FKM82_020782 [Ascaphus truei]